MSKPTTDTLSSNAENQINENNNGSDSNHLKSNNFSNGVSPQNFNRPKTSMSSVDKKKMGHREVKDGVVHYKKVSSDELKRSIQFGIVHSVSFSNKYPDRDILIQDFPEVVCINFPK